MDWNPGLLCPSPNGGVWLVTAVGVRVQFLSARGRWGSSYRNNSAVSACCDVSDTGVTALSTYLILTNVMRHTI